MALILCGSMYSQTEISGSVSDADSMDGIPGVNVIIDGTNIGTVTDFDGNFTIANFESGSTLVFSYVGYKTLNLKISATDVISDNISVSMDKDLSELDEVIVIGYGSQKLSDISGAVSTVNADAIEASSPVRVEDALQGQASGINIISSGSPGSKPTVLIRGITSYAGNDPLVVIDGISASIDDLNSLNPNDVKSVNVLKDAALASIYGVKGGSGVIVITTKSGERNSETKFTLSTSIGTQEVVRTIDVLNASEYAAILNEASVNAGEGIVFPNISDFGVGTNWQDEVLVDAPIVNHSITASGGSENTSYYVSAGYTGQDGVIAGGEKSFFNRTNFTTNINTDLSEKTKLLINTNYSNIKGKSLAENGITSVLSNALNFDPTVSPYENGTFGISETITQEIVNPLAQIYYTYNQNKVNKFTGKIELQYDLIKDLKVTSRFGYTYVDIYDKSFVPLQFYGSGHNQTNSEPDLSPIVSVDSEGNSTSTHNRVTEGHTNYFTYTYELYGNYDFSINGIHNFQTVAGFSGIVTGISTEVIGVSTLGLRIGLKKSSGNFTGLNAGFPIYIFDTHVGTGLTSLNTSGNNNDVVGIGTTFADNVYVIQSISASGTTAEILVNNNAVANLIREAKASQVYSQLQIGGKFGMQTLEQCLSVLVAQSKITTDEALYKCNRPNVLKGLLDEINTEITNKP